MGAANSRLGLTRTVTVSKCMRVCKHHMFWLHESSIGVKVRQVTATAKATPSMQSKNGVLSRLCSTATVCRFHQAVPHWTQRFGNTQTLESIVWSADGTFLYQGTVAPPRCSGDNSKVGAQAVRWQIPVAASSHTLVLWSHILLLPAWSHNANALATEGVACTRALFRR